MIFFRRRNFQIPSLPRKKERRRIEIPFESRTKPSPFRTTKMSENNKRVLYWGSGSAPAWRVMIALAEKELVRGLDGND